MIDSKLSSLEFLSVLCDSANRAISESSCDQLAGIKSDAVLSLIDSDLGHGIDTGCFSSDWVYTTDEVKCHADKLRGETK